MPPGLESPRGRYGARLRGDVGVETLSAKHEKHEKQEKHDGVDKLFKIIVYKFI